MNKINLVLNSAADTQVLQHWSDLRTTRYQQVGSFFRQLLLLKSLVGLVQNYYILLKYKRTTVTLSLTILRKQDRPYHRGTVLRQTKLTQQTSTFQVIQVVCTTCGAPVFVGHNDKSDYSWSLSSESDSKKLFVTNAKSIGSPLSIRFLAEEIIPINLLNSLAGFVFAGHKRLTIFCSIGRL